MENLGVCVNRWAMPTIKIQVIASRGSRWTNYQGECGTRGEDYGTVPLTGALSASVYPGLLNGHVT